MSTEEFRPVPGAPVIQRAEGDSVWTELILVVCTQCGSLVANDDHNKELHRAWHVLLRDSVRTLLGDSGQWGLFS